MVRYQKPRRRSKVEAITHTGDARRNIPTAELAPVMSDADREGIRVAYERRNRDLDPQLVWRGKDEQDETDLVTPAPPLYIEEKVHPKALIDDLIRHSRDSEEETDEYQTDLFADFNGLPEGADKTEFYKHDANWSNRMVLGDSLQVMASLAEREGLRGKVQCIYIDPPYGIRFNSNFQWSTTSRDVRDGNPAHITREPEQVKAFRDTWRDGVHSYLSYLRDRLTAARDMLTESGSVFVQIGDENVHRVRAVMDEVFGEENSISIIPFVTTGGQSASDLGNIFNYLVWYAKDRSSLKYRQLYQGKDLREGGGWAHSRVQFDDATRRNIGVPEVRRLTEAEQNIRPYSLDGISSQGLTITGSEEFIFEGRVFKCGQNAHWKTSPSGMSRLARAWRIESSTNSIRYVRFLDDFPIQPITNLWSDTNRPGYIDIKTYVVQTSAKVVERCILMTTDPGDLVLDPTCGAGTTAYAAEQWGRRWITIDTSRVALALARARIMGARYPYYLLADSEEGQRKEAEVTHRIPSDAPTYGDVRQGFVYERVPHIQLRDIANNAAIDVIWENYQETLEPLREQLNSALGESWEEWEIPREAAEGWPQRTRELHAAWWEQRAARQREIEASIANNAETEYLYDKPYEDRSKVRVAGPFTVENLSPHRAPLVDDDELRQPAGSDPREGREAGPGHRYQGEAPERDFAADMLEQLRVAGVQ